MTFLPSIFHLYINDFNFYSKKMNFIHLPDSSTAYAKKNNRSTDQWK